MARRLGVMLIVRGYKALLVRGRQGPGLQSILLQHAGVDIHLRALYLLICPHQAAMGGQGGIAKGPIFPVIEACVLQRRREHKHFSASFCLIFSP